MKTMTFSAAAVVLLSLLTPCRAQETNTGIQLRGIAQVAEETLALLERPAGPAWNRNLLLARGQREGETEVLDIDRSSGRVRIRDGKETRELALPADLVGAPRVEPSVEGQGPNEAPATLRLNNAGPGLVFPLYQRLARRTLLRPAALPDFRLDLAVTEPATTSQAQAALERALAGKGIFLRADRDKFAVAVREQSFTQLPAELWQLAEQLGRPDRPSTPDQTGEERLPAGTINFPNTDLNQVLRIYQELANRTVIHPPILPSPTISLKTYTPLSRTEAIYAFSAALFLNGISVVPAGDKFLLVMPSFRAKDAAAMVAQKPVIAPAATQPIPAGAINLSPADLGQVAALYQQLSGQAVEVDPSVPGIRSALKTQTALAPAEALQALDLLLACQDLAVVPSSTGGGLKVVRRERAQ